MPDTLNVHEYPSRKFLSPRWGFTSSDLPKSLTDYHFCQILFYPNFKLEFFYFQNYITIPSTIGTGIVDGIFFVLLIF